MTPIGWFLPADRAFVIPTGAMDPTLIVSDRKAAYIYSLGAKP